MAAKKNPLKLNALQLRTLTILQALARLPEIGTPGPEPGEVTLTRFPRPHLDHFHLGDAVVSGSDATGLFNPSVWHALDRKGLARANWPKDITLTAGGVAYDTGLGDRILRRNPHA